MKLYTLEEVLEEVCRRDFAEFDNPPNHCFSLRHRRNMNRILSPKREKSASAKIKLTPKTAVAILLIIFLGLFTGAKIILRLPGFLGTIYPDNTQMFAFDDTAPTTIEKIFYLEALPDNYFLTERKGYIDDERIESVYINRYNGDSLIFYQYTKNRYHAKYDNEHSIFVSVEINGYNGFIWKSKDPNHKLKSIVWDEGEYILEVLGEFTENEMLDLAKSTKVLKN